MSYKSNQHKKFVTKLHIIKLIFIVFEFKTGPNLFFFSLSQRLILFRFSVLISSNVSNIRTGSVGITLRSCCRSFKINSRLQVLFVTEQNLVLFSDC